MLSWQASVDYLTVDWNDYYLAVDYPGWQQLIGIIITGRGLSGLASVDYLAVDYPGWHLLIICPLIVIIIIWVWIILAGIC